MLYVRHSISLDGQTTSHCMYLILVNFHRFSNGPKNSPRVPIGIMCMICRGIRALMYLIYMKEALLRYMKHKLLMMGSNSYYFSYIKVRVFSYQDHSTNSHPYPISFPFLLFTMKFFLSSAAILLLSVQQALAAKTCAVKSSGGDDASNIVDAFNNCNNGGTVEFTKGTAYNLKSVVSVEKLQDVTVKFEGTINLPTYNTKFEDEKAFIYLAGDNIHFSGAGTINGNGQGWYVVLMILLIIT